MQQNKRIAWIDGARLIAIFLVFLVHYDTAVTGSLNTIGLACAVPSFFFFSGIFARRGQPCSGLAAKTKSLLLPYAVFALINLLVPVLYNPSSAGALPADALRYLMGRRNDLPAASMWFLPCLAVVAWLWEFVFARIGQVWLRIGAAAAVSLLARLLFEEPVWLLSGNVALRYLVYYVLGEAFGAWWRSRTTEQMPTARHGVFCAATGGIMLTVVLFALGSNALYGPLGSSRLYTVAASFVFALGGTAAIGAAGALLGKLKPVRIAGEYSMVLCCTETIGRALLASILALFGIGITPSRMLTCVCYNALVVLFLFVVAVLPIRRFCPALAGKHRAKLPKEKTR